MEKYIKFLTADGRGRSSDYAWPLPTDDGPGEWVEVKGSVEACRNGLHAATLIQALGWLDATAYEIEYDPAAPPLEDANKVIGRRARRSRRDLPRLGPSLRRPRRLPGRLAPAPRARRL